MDWKLLLTAFTTVFLAEIGDKTQLATLSLATGGRSKLSVFLGAACALVAASGIAVLVGGALTRVVPEVWLRRGAAVLLIVVGVLLLFEGRED